MTDSPDIFDTLAETAAARGAPAMFEALADSLKASRRWHALFDLRMLEARVALGLPPTGDIGAIDEQARERLDERSLAACREVGWPLLDEGHVAAGWMYLRAAAEPAEVSRKLAALARAPLADEEAAAARMQEIVQIALWEGIDPALGIRLVIESQGTCNSITAFEQAVSRLPAARQRQPAAVLVEHLHRELLQSLAADLERRGLAPHETIAATASIVGLLDAAGGMKDDPSFHIDVSHLQSVLRIARVCTERAVIEKAWELSVYACRLPDEVTYPGEPPFETVGEASRLFYAAQLGRDIDEALRYFRKAAALARVEDAGTLPADTLVYLLWRLDRPAEALHAALERPADHGMPSVMQAIGMLPSLVELAEAGNAIDALREACRNRGDEITFAATYAAVQRTRN
jgi:tetratricopeptide (TPR) repeat protein